MSSVNSVTLLGRLGKDPELRSINSDSNVANLSLATSEKWKDKQTGEMQERTEWHRIVMFDKLADIAGQYLKKGSQVYIEGKLQTRKWQDQDGKDRYSTEVMVSGFNGKMVMLGEGKGDERQGGGNQQQSSHNQSSGDYGTASRGGGNPDARRFSNDDIPF